jgi:hypothetical protein
MAGKLTFNLADMFEAVADAWESEPRSSPANDA